MPWICSSHVSSGKSGLHFCPSSLINKPISLWNFSVWIQKRSCWSFFSGSPQPSKLRNRPDSWAFFFLKKWLTHPDFDCECSQFPLVFQDSTHFGQQWLLFPFGLKLEMDKCCRCWTPMRKYFRYRPYLQIIEVYLPSLPYYFRMSQSWSGF